MAKLENAGKDTTLKWKAEVTFEGTLEEFNEFKAALVRHPIEIEIAEFSSLAAGKIIDRTSSGYAHFDYATVFQREQFEQLIKDSPRLEFKRIRGFAGGIRTPHLHIGDEVILVDKERFKTILGQVAKNIFETRVETQDDFCKIIEPMVGI